MIATDIFIMYNRTDGYYLCDGTKIYYMDGASDTQIDPYKEMAFLWVSQSWIV